MKHLQRRLLDLKIKMKANLDRFLISGHLRLIAVLTGRVFFFSSLKSSQLWNPLFFIQQQLQFYPSFISAIKMSRLESDFSSSSTSELLPIPQINIIQNRIELLCYETPCVSSSRSVSSLASCFSNFSYKQKEGFFLQLRDSFYSSPISKAFGERLKPRCVRVVESAFHIGRWDLDASLSPSCSLSGLKQGVRHLRLLGLQLAAPLSLWVTILPWVKLHSSMHIRHICQNTKIKQSWDVWRALQVF